MVWDRLSSSAQPPHLARTQSKVEAEERDGVGLLVPDGRVKTMKVLVGVDGSAYSAALIRYVVGATWPKHARFLVLSAVTTIFGTGEARASDAISEIMKRQVKHHRAISERAAARLEAAGLTAEAETAIGDPRTVLIDAARGKRVALVVVGSRGSTGVKKLLLGSVASHVVTHAPCSVLVVRKGVARGD